MIISIGYIIEVKNVENFTDFLYAVYTHFTRYL